MDFIIQCLMAKLYKTHPLFLVRMLRNYRYKFVVRTKQVKNSLEWNLSTLTSLLHNDCYILHQQKSINKIVTNGTQME